MDKYKSFGELKRVCLDFVESAKKRGSYEGVRRLLTELYPDRAHFIYELLQNAEDKEATEVRFELYNNRLQFWHNGKKRDFTLDDIDAITNIGQSTKIDDPTTIGKFGVGFKAVYSYTNTPEIHSGEYDFKIIDMLVPEDEGVEKRAQKGSTLFVFPFDNPNKKPEIAVSEITEGLQTLDENSILFLSSIKKISFRLSNGFEGYVKIEDDDGYLKTIATLKPSTARQYTYWYKFSKKCSIVVDGQEKEYPIAIAFKMLKTQEGILKADASLKGNVCIYFKAEKETSNLKFHIHAPFASTVARDSIRTCEENRVLLKGIGELVEEAVDHFKEMGFLNLSFYAVLPNKNDFKVTDSYSFISKKMELMEPTLEENPYYHLIYKKIRLKFRNEALLITDEGEYRRNYLVRRVNRDVANLIATKEMIRLKNIGWMPAVTPQSPEHYFLNDVEVKSFDLEELLEEFQQNNDLMGSIFDGKEKEWFADFSLLLHSIKSNTLMEYLPILKKMKMIPCEDGERYRALDKIYIKSNYTPKNIDRPLYVDFGSIHPSKFGQVKLFLRQLGVGEITEKEDIEIGLKNSGANFSDAIKVLSDILNLMQQSEEEAVRKYKDIPFLLARRIDNADTRIYKVKVEQCCLSKVCSFFYRRNSKVQFVFAEDQYPDVIQEVTTGIYRMFEKFGGKTRPQVLRIDPFNNTHPLYSKLDTYNERSETATKIDYSITGIQQIGEIADYDKKAEALMLWKMLNNEKRVGLHRATYKKNRSASEQYVDSSLAYYLKSVAWIIGADGRYYKPREITFEELSEEWKTVGNISTIVRDIGFGQKPNLINNAVEMVRKIEGVDLPSSLLKEFFGLSEEKAKKALELLKREEAAEATKTDGSFADAINKGNKKQVAGENVEEREDVSARNLEAREKKMRKIFEEGLSKNTPRYKKFSFTYVKSKSSQEKEYVGSEYKGYCQMCNRPPIRSYSNQLVFEAINIIDTGSLGDKFQHDLAAGWNTLCLCPNCAAEYKYCAKELSTFVSQVLEIDVGNKAEDYIRVNLLLQNKNREIRFTPKHFTNLKAALTVFMNE